MEIAKKVLKELNSFETSELQRVLEGMEMQEYYVSGHSGICGGFELAEAYGIEADEFYDENDDFEDAIEIELESGENDGSRTSSTKVCYKIPRSVLDDKEMCLKDKLGKIEEA